MKSVLIFITILNCGLAASAQPRFVTKGKIEFERKTNIHRLYYNEEEMGSWSETMKKLIPQFRVNYFDLVFTEEKTLYKPGRENPDNKSAGFFPPPASENVIFKDLERQTGVSQKQIYESTFLIIDSLRNVTWKLQPEIRTIAGFECRKAIARICDSVVVVAFYTDEIVPASGPEGFHGLPGMILGLAVPRLYTTWFATKLELLAVGDETKIVAPAKGKKVSDHEAISKVNDGIKDWGEKYRDKALWLTSL
jgi:GLPGLI family protein